MKQLIVTIIFLLAYLALTSCRQSYQIVFGETYFSTFCKSGNHLHSMTSGLKQHSQFSVSGVYSQKQFSKKYLPAVINFDKDNGIGYTVLAKSLTVKRGTWVRVEGSISDTLLSFGVTGTNMLSSVLRVNDFAQLGDFSPILCTTQKEYDKIRQKLQASITPKESKLILPSNPEWQLLVDEESVQVIVYMVTNDLMYTAEVDFVFDINEIKLITVYANEWFKGE